MYKNKFVNLIIFWGRGHQTEYNHWNCNIFLDLQNCQKSLLWISENSFCNKNEIVTKILLISWLKLLFLFTVTKSSFLWVSICNWPLVIRKSLNFWTGKWIELLFLIGYLFPCLMALFKFDPSVMYLLCFSKINFSISKSCFGFDDFEKFFSTWHYSRTRINKCSIEVCENYFQFCELNLQLFIKTQLLTLKFSRSSCSGNHIQCYFIIYSTVNYFHVFALLKIVNPLKF